MSKKKSKSYLYDNQGGSEQRFEVRLQKLVKAWQKKQEPSLQHRHNLLALWASGFFDPGYTRQHLINLVDRGVSTIVPFLVEGNPQIMVDTLVGKYRPWAFTTQLMLNFLVKNMNLADSVLIPAARNAIFGAGITRTFTEYNRQINLDNEVIMGGTPTIRVIDDADYIGDPAAKSRSDFIIEGDVYKLPTAYARELFSKYADYIMPDCRLVSEYHPDKISEGEFDFNRLSLRDYSTFQDIYLYDEGVTVTIMPEGKKARILRTVEEDGPGGSPYDFLGFEYFPGTTYPIPPAWRWHDLDVTMNLLADKARQQAESQKDLIFVPPSEKELGVKVRDARNLDILTVMTPESIKKESFGGVNPDNYNWMQFAESAFTKTGANPDVIAGRGSQSPTLGQEQLVYANATRIVNNMYTRYQHFMESILRKLAWRIWTDPTVYFQFLHEIPGVGQIPKVFSQADKVGDFYDFVFKIKPYSTQRTSPEVMYQKMMGFMSQWILPTYGFAAQQGAQLDIPIVTRILSDYLGFENFNQWYKTATPQPTDSIDYQMQPMKNKFGQGNDYFGATSESKNANLKQQQDREAGTM